MQGGQTPTRSEVPSSVVLVDQASSPLRSMHIVNTLFHAAPDVITSFGSIRAPQLKDYIIHLYRCIWFLSLYCNVLLTADRLLETRENSLMEEND